MANNMLKQETPLRLGQLDKNVVVVAEKRLYCLDWMKKV